VFDWNLYLGEADITFPKFCQIELKYGEIHHITVTAIVSEVWKPFAGGSVISRANMDAQAQ
jgi:hypothetical protein